MLRHLIPVMLSTLVVQISYFAALLDSEVRQGILFRAYKKYQRVSAWENQWAIQ